MTTAVQRELGVELTFSLFSREGRVIWWDITVSGIIVISCNSDRSEKNKPDHLYSSPGPLSSIKAAFKRTAGRSYSQGDGGRERRRPEITILSVEPLPTSAWFPGVSGRFQTPPPSSQSVWDGGIHSSAQSPPSYDQVIKEKTQEKVEAPTVPPRQSHTHTTATQTDRSEEHTSQHRHTADTVLGKPTKPPRPSQPKTLSVKPAAPAADTHTEATQNDSEPSQRRRPVPRPRSKPPQTKENQILIQLQDTNGCDAVTSLEYETHSSGTYLTELLEALLDSEEVQEDQKDQGEEDLSENMNGLHSSRNIRARIQALESQNNSNEAGVPLPRPHNVYSPLPVGVPKPPVAPRPSISSAEILSTAAALNSGTAVNSASALNSARALNSATGLNSAAAFNSASAHYSTAPFSAAEALNSARALNSATGLNSATPFNSEAAFNSASSHYSTAPFTAAEAFNSARALNSATGINSAAAFNSASRLNSAITEGFSDNFNPEKEADDYYEEVNIASVPPPLAPKPQPPRKPSVSSKPETKPPPNSIKTVLLPPRPPLVKLKTVDFQDEEGEDPFKSPPPAPLKPNKDVLNTNNHNSTALALSSAFNQYTDAADSHVPVKPARAGGVPGNQYSVKRPTVIRVPSRVSKNEDEGFDLPPPPLPVQKAVGGRIPPPTLTHRASFSSAADPVLPPRPVGGKVAPPRPPPAKTAPGRPPPPRRNTVQFPVHHQMVPPQSNPQQLSRPRPKSTKKGPVLPPRPNPGHKLYNTYTLEIPHAIAEYDYNSAQLGELSFQKNEVLVLLSEIDSKTLECQVGDAKGTVQKSYVKIITPLSSSFSDMNYPAPTQAFGNPVKNCTFEVQALYDFTPEGPGELALRAGDVVTNVEQLDNEWYLGNCRGVTGFFPINYAKPLSQPGTPAPAPVNPRKKQPSADTVRGPRCVARFDFEGEQSDELSFSEGDVIGLKEYLGEEWAQGELRGKLGIFPLNFVEIVEDLPSSTSEHNHSKIPLPGMAASPVSPTPPSPAQVENRGGIQWVVALYDFTPEAEDELGFVQGDVIMLKELLDADWCRGRLNGREGIFPSAFVQKCTGGFS
ncbi:SH3 domain-containing protein 19 [Hoplias malabaricus]|uniref:SH3 domain-containing protein 19 n=1 Tax=Hoplias malabaricus TaxID=27720 RepID=UPI00346283CE